MLILCRISHENETAVYHKHTFIYLLLMYSVSTEKSYIMAYVYGQHSERMRPRRDENKNKTRDIYTSTRRLDTSSLSPFSLYVIARDPMKLSSRRTSNHVAHIHNPTSPPSQTQRCNNITVTEPKREKNNDTCVCMYTSFDSVA